MVFERFRYAATTIAAVAMVFSIATGAAAGSLADVERAFEHEHYRTVREHAEPLAKSGNRAAQVYMGILAERGDVGTADVERAAAWYLKAVKQNSVAGAYNLARLFAAGRGGVAKDRDKAVTLYRAAAERGLAKAAFNLGVMYDRGDGVVVDHGKALDWYRQAADGGVAQAKVNLGALYHEGHGVERDYDKAASWYEAAVADGIGRAHYNLGLLKTDIFGARKKPESAARHLGEAARKGVADAKVLLGFLYYAGKQVERDRDKSRQLAIAAARDGNRWGQFLAGLHFMEGAGGPKNQDRAMSHFRDAAEQDVALAQFLVAVGYAQGKGLAQDFQQAGSWLKRAAENGQAKAQLLRGKFYIKGKGVPKDVETGARWLRRAAENGSAKAKDILAEMGVDTSGIATATNGGDIGSQFEKAYQASLKRIRALGPLNTVALPRVDAGAQTADASETESASGRSDAELVRAIQTHLADAGFHDGAIDGVYGPNTRRSIKRFQEATDLDVTGKPTQNLLTRIKAYIDGKRAVANGDEAEPDSNASDRVREIQRRLAERGFFDGAVDGVHGQTTRAAIERFQKSAGLKVTGEPSKSVLQRLRNVTASSEGFTPPKNPYDVAVIVGNRNYAHAPDVRYAHADADAVARYAREVLGIREGNILDLRDATKAELENMFGNAASHEGKLFYLLKRGKSEVVVFYSGHGVPAHTDGAAKGYLLPVDGRPGSPKLSGYPLDRLYANLKKLPAERVTVMLDACFSGLTQGGTLVEKTSGSFGVSVKAPEPETALAVLTATAFDRAQYAHWLPEKEHGAFTYYALKGLYGKADNKRYGTADGTVTLREVEAYLNDRMRYAVRRRYQRDQQPSLLAPEDANLALSHFPEDQPRPDIPLP